MSFADAREVWNRRFDRPDYLFGTAPNRFLAAQAHRLRPGLRALSIADGEGRNAVWLAEQGLQVRAIEISPVAVDKARRLAAERGVAPEFEVTDLLAWPWPRAAFDVIAAIFFQFAAPAERLRLFDAIIAALAPGGLLILQGYTPRQIEYATGGPPFPENMYTAPLLREAFAALDILHLEEHEDMLAEGSGHLGRSALIDLVAARPR
jgi:SAM-dependent methyltransferase